MIDVFGDFGEIETETAALLTIYGVEDKEYSEDEII